MFKNEFEGTVEFDECYVGGSEEGKHTVNQFECENWFNYCD